MDEVENELISVCLRLSIIDEKNHGAVGGKELNNRTELNLYEWFGVEPTNVFTQYYS